MSYVIASNDIIYNRYSDGDDGDDDGGGALMY